MSMWTLSSLQFSNGEIITAFSIGVFCWQSEAFHKSTTNFATLTPLDRAGRLRLWMKIVEQSDDNRIETESEVMDLEVKDHTRASGTKKLYELMTWRQSNIRLLSFIGMIPFIKLFPALEPHPEDLNRAFDAT